MIKKAIKALTLVLRAKYPNIKVADRELEHAPVPCFYINIIDVKENRLNQFLTEQIIDFEVIYFAEYLHTGYIDLLTKQSELTELLQQLIPIDDGYILPSDLDFNVNRKDYLLSTMFSLTIQKSSMLKDPKGNNNELIQTLNTNYKD